MDCLLPVFPSLVRQTDSLAWPCSQQSQASRAFLAVESLETRLVPAFDLTIGAGPSFEVVVTTTGAITTLTPDAHGANLAVSDLRGIMQCVGRIVITDGNAGSEAGNITWLAGNNLDYNGFGTGGYGLAIVTDPSATVGNIVLNSAIFDSGAIGANAVSRQPQRQGQRADQRQRHGRFGAGHPGG